MMNALAALGIIVWVTSMIMTTYGTLILLRHFTRKQSRIGTHPIPVSVIKPLKGLDHELSLNLESFFQIKYPAAFELIFCIDSPEDPSAAVVEQLLTKYPDADAKVFLGASAVGSNPKVNNIYRAYHSASYDHILISDSNVRVPKTYLADMMADFTSDTGVLTSVVAGVQPESFAGYMESTILGTFYARFMLLSIQAGIPSVVGKSMLFRKNTAERFGGIKALADYLAEDYMTGDAMKRLGLKTKAASHPIPQIIGPYSFKAHWDRHLRWGKIRKSHAPLPFFFEPVFSILPSHIIGYFSLANFLDVSLSVFSTLHFGIWFASDYLTYRATQAEYRFSSLRYALAWALREALYPLQWLSIAKSNTIQWRGNHLKIQLGGKICRPSSPSL